MEPLTPAEMAKKSHERLNGLTKEQKGQYFSLIRNGKKREARDWLKLCTSPVDMRTS